MDELVAYVYKGILIHGCAFEDTCNQYIAYDLYWLIEDADRMRQSESNG